MVSSVSPGLGMRRVAVGLAVNDGAAHHKHGAGNAALFDEEAEGAVERGGTGKGLGQRGGREAAQAKAYGSIIRMPLPGSRSVTLRRAACSHRDPGEGAGSGGGVGSATRGSRDGELMETPSGGGETRGVSGRGGPPL
jgi:hypothetical protein